MNLKNDLDKNNNLLGKDRRCKVWAIGGGKGGVGKSLVTANTSICLALMGYKVETSHILFQHAHLHVLVLNSPSLQIVILNLRHVSFLPFSFLRQERNQV